MARTQVVTATPANESIGSSKKRRTPKKPALKMPSHWTGDTSISSREQVPESVKEGIQAMMDGTWKDVITRDRFTCGTGDAVIQKYEVVQVLRNQNPVSWANYASKRDAIRSELIFSNANSNHRHRLFKPMTCNPSFLRKFKSKGDKKGEVIYGGENEMLLFHGTTPSAAESICDNHFRLGSPDALFGQGVYFAECSSKSDEYVKEDGDSVYKGLYATLLCRVMMGRVQYNTERFPDVEKLTSSVETGDYNSVIGDREQVRGTYREFVVYDGEQAYPEYVVIYRRVKSKNNKKTGKGGK